MFKYKCPKCGKECEAFDYDLDVSNINEVEVIFYYDCEDCCDLWSISVSYAATSAVCHYNKVVEVEEPIQLNETEDCDITTCTTTKGSETITLKDTGMSNEAWEEFMRAFSLDWLTSEDDDFENTVKPEKKTDDFWAKPKKMPKKPSN